MPHPYLLKKQPSGAKVSQYNRKTGKIEVPEDHPPAPAPAGDGQKSGDTNLNLLSAASALASLEGPPPLPGQEVQVANPPAAAPAAAEPSPQQAAGIDTSGDGSPGKSKTADRNNNKRFPDLVSSSKAQKNDLSDRSRKLLVDLLDKCLEICSSTPL